MVWPRMTQSRTETERTETQMTMDFIQNVLKEGVSLSEKTD